MPPYKVSELEFAMLFCSKEMYSEMLRKKDEKILFLRQSWDEEYQKALEENWDKEVTVNCEFNSSVR